jgi:hypothetical protein
VKPFATSGLGIDDGQPHELATDSSGLKAASCPRVDQECVVSSVPGDVDQSDEKLVPVATADPAETVCSDPVPPPDTRAATVRPLEVDDLLVGHGSPLGVGDHVGHS